MRKRYLFILTIAFFIANIPFAQAQNPEKNEDVGEEVFFSVEEMPEYKGVNGVGARAMFEFIFSNINYPASAKMNNIEGRVIASFIVDKEGNLTDIHIKEGIGYGCDKEVIRLIELMPKWKPGQQKGKPVSVQYNLPVKFSLEGKKKKSKKEKRKRRG